MSFEIGTLTGANCHRQFVARVQAVAEEADWETLRSTSTEWIGKSSGLSETEEIYLGISSYESVPSDYYNVLIGVFTGYVSGNTFANQPGARTSGVPAHNSALTYYLTANKQRIAFGLKVGPPVYMHGYMGKMFPYSMPTNYPYPVVCAGMLNGAQAIRYDNTSLRMPYPGPTGPGATNHNLYLRDLSGNWVGVRGYPWVAGASSSNALMGSTTMLVPPEASPPYTYLLPPVILSENVNTAPANVWGELDGLRACSGFGAISENIIQEGGSSVVDQTGMTKTDAVDAIHAVGGKAYVLLQDVYRNTFVSFVALEMA